jgi:hypothetical protein
MHRGVLSNNLRITGATHVFFIIGDPVALVDSHRTAMR